MNEINIGIIDSGIQSDHKAFANVRAIRGYNVLDGSGDVHDEDVSIERGGHGTGICSIIVKHLEKSLPRCNFHIIKIFDERGYTSEEYLISAIRYCIDKKLDLVNLSLGIETANPSGDIESICKEAYDEGIILVAATSDNSVSTYPAYSPYVFGVVGGIIQASRDYGVLKGGPVEFVGKGNLQRVASPDSGYKFIAGNSQAAAHITGIIANLLLENSSWGFEDIKEYMFRTGRTDVRLFTNRHMQYMNIADWIGTRIKSNEEEADRLIRSAFDNSERLSWMKNVALYPFSNKELKAFRHYSDMCPYNIVEVYDFPKFAAKESSVELQGKEIKVKWDIDESSFKDIDTIVIGHPFETAIELNSVFAEKIIDRCIELGKNFYVFDSHLYNELKNRVEGTGCIVYHPDNSVDIFRKISKAFKFKKLKKPNITVVGVSPRSGKFTTQLKIKQLLEKKGYSVGWLATEPQSELFDCDHCFPIGEEISQLTIGSWPYYLKTMLSVIEQYKKPDIILSGHQSTLVHSGRNPFSNDTLRSINFLSSVEPDAVVCSVNPAYAGERLDKVIKVLDAVYDIPVLFFSLSRKYIKPKLMDSGMIFLTEEIISDEEWGGIADDIRQRYNKEVVDPLDESFAGVITDSICNFF